MEEIDSNSDHLENFTLKLFLLIIQEKTNHVLSDIM